MAGARAGVHPLIAAASGLSCPARLLAVGMSFEFANQTPKLSADLEMLCDNLTPGIERVIGLNADDLET